MKWLSWLRKSHADDQPTVVMPPRASARPRPARPGAVDWERLDNPAEGNDPFATGSFEAMQEGDPRQREVMNELDALRQPKAGKKQAAYNPYETSGFKVSYSNQPERGEDADDRPRRPKTSYNPYDTGTFHGSWNKQPR